jgi:hypothetical protein
MRSFAAIIPSMSERKSCGRGPMNSGSGSPWSSRSPRKTPSVRKRCVQRPFPARFSPCQSEPRLLVRPTERSRSSQSPKTTSSTQRTASHPEGVRCIVLAFKAGIPPNRRGFPGE